MLTVVDFIELPIGSFKTVTIDVLNRIEDDLNKKGLHSYCDCCHKSIKNIFVVYDSEEDKTICLGTECVKTYTGKKKEKTISVDEKLPDKKFKKITRKIEKIEGLEIDCPF